MPDGTGIPPRGQEDRSVGELVFDVAEKGSSLVREEIELAKTEITEKVAKILRGSVVGLAAGTFAFLALILIMEGVAWLLAEEVFDGNAWPGFFVEAALFLLSRPAPVSSPTARSRPARRRCPSRRSKRRS